MNWPDVSHLRCWLNRLDHNRPSQEENQKTTHQATRPSIRDSSKFQFEIRQKNSGFQSLLCSSFPAVRFQQLPELEIELKFYYIYYFSKALNCFSSFISSLWYNPSQRTLRNFWKKDIQLRLHLENVKEQSIIKRKKHRRNGMAK